MILFLVLVAVFVVALLVPTHGGRRSARDAARLAMAAAMAFSGVSHFAKPAAFIRLLPAFVPAREAVILWTGVMEVLLGGGLVAPRRWRREVALALVAYLIAVFPANVYVAVARVPLDDLGGGNRWLRLPFQAVYISWVFWAVPDLPEPARAAIGRLRRQVGR
jgi:uncharacterized membrane protein